MLNKNTKILLTSASIMMALGIIIGAFGAHALKQFVSDELMVVFETGVKYHFFNTLGLFAIAFILNLIQNSKLIFINSLLKFRDFDPNQFVIVHHWAEFRAICATPS